MTVPVFKDIRLVSSGWINKYILTYELPDGSSYEYESTSRKSLADYRAVLEADVREKEKPDGVCIVPILPDGSVLMIREFRYAINAWIVTFPAGLKEPGESVRECIDRELAEETGYRVRRDLGDDALRMLPQTGFSSIGMTDENVEVAFVQVEAGGCASTERGEFIESFILPRSKIADFLENNTDLIGVRAQLVLEGLKQRPGR